MMMKANKGWHRKRWHREFPEWLNLSLCDGVCVCVCVYLDFRQSQPLIHQLYIWCTTKLEVEWFSWRPAIREWRIGFFSQSACSNQLARPTTTILSLFVMVCSRKLMEERSSRNWRWRRSWRAKWSWRLRWGSSGKGWRSVDQTIAGAGATASEDGQWRVKNLNSPLLANKTAKPFHRFLSEFLSISPSASQADAGIQSVHSPSDEHRLSYNHTKLTQFIFLTSSRK